MLKNRLSLKIILILISTDFLETFTNFCFKKSAIPENGLTILNLSQGIIFIKAVLSSGFLWLGLLSVILTFIIWATMLSKVDLSVAVPICSFSYILVPLVSTYLLHEKISLLRWTGILFILAGVIFVSISTSKKEAKVR